MSEALRLPKLFGPKLAAKTCQNMPTPDHSTAFVTSAHNENRFGFHPGVVLEFNAVCNEAPN